MNKQKTDYFREMLLDQRTRALDSLHDDRDDVPDQPDGVVDPEEASELELEKSTALDMAGRESELVEEIDDALQRIEDGTYGECERCGKPIAEERLEALPSARYDLACQQIIEAAEEIETPTL